MTTQVGICFTGDGFLSGRPRLLSCTWAQSKNALLLDRIGRSAVQYLTTYRYAGKLSVQVNQSIATAPLRCQARGVSLLTAGDYHNDPTE